MASQGQAQVRLTWFQRLRSLVTCRVTDSEHPALVTGTREAVSAAQLESVDPGCLGGGGWCRQRDPPLLETWLVWKLFLSYRKKVPMIARKKETAWKLP